MQKLIHVALAAFLVLSVACGRSPVHSSDTDIEAALDQISVDAVRTHFEILSDDGMQGRETGKPGYDEAAAYVAAQFELLGLLPAGSEGWYQPVPLSNYAIGTTEPTMFVHRGDETIELVYRDDFIVQADAVRPTSSVRAEIVYAGHGVHAPEFGYDDFADVDVEGKILAIFRGTPEIIEGSRRAHHAASLTKRQAAAERGAVGFISLRTDEQEARSPWSSMRQNTRKRSKMTWVSNDGRDGEYFSKLEAAAAVSPATAETLFSLSPLSFEQALEANRDGLAASAPLGVEVSISFSSEHDAVSSRNVLGMIRGTDPVLADEFVVYTAHLDHLGVHDGHGETDDDGEVADYLYNGAYDNAMGVALMLETARALADAPPKRSVLFIAVTAEEKGLLGSDYYVSNPTVPVDSIVANVNLDMPLFLYPLADLVAFGSEHSSLHDVVAASAAKEGFELSPDPMPEQNLFVRSDQYSFVRKGVPAVFLIPGFTSLNEDIDGEEMFMDHLKNHYHKPSDDLTRPVHWPSSLRFVRANARIGFSVGQNPKRPTWNEGDYFGETYGQ